ncbi:MAG: hypothetical protein PVH19_13900 [Planctomycetia bacterium]|jgi:hypothetical protein
MTKNQIICKHECSIFFEYSLDENIIYELGQKGWCCAQLVVSKKVICPLTFYDPIRLQQDFEAEIECGNHYLFVPNIIVIPEINISNMKSAVESLFQSGELDHLLGGEL